MLPLLLWVDEDALKLYCMLCIDAVDLHVGHYYLL